MEVCVIIVFSLALASQFEPPMPSGEATQTAKAKKREQVDGKVTKLELTPEQQRLAKERDFLWAGMRDQRTKLSTGEFLAGGRKLSVSNIAGRLEGEVKIHGAFDAGERKFRFDRVEPRRKPRGSTVRPAVRKDVVIAKLDTGIEGGRFVRVPGKTISFVEGNLNIEIQLETSPPPPQIRPFDVRGLGLYYPVELDNFIDYEQLLINWSVVVPDEIVDEGGGISRVRWVLGKDLPVNTQRTLWIDKSKGFSPIRYELRERVAGVGGPWSEARTTSETTWEEISGTWVLRTFRIEWGGGPVSRTVYELGFDWTAVNTPVPPEVFSIEGMKIDKDYAIIESRLSRPITVGRIRDDHKPEFEGPTEEVAEERFAPGSRISVVTLIGGLGALGALAAASWIGYRNYTSSRR